jgi:transposase
MEYPASVIEKAQQMEHLLIQVEQGIGLEEACAQLDIQVNARQLSLLQAKYQAGERRWEALLDGRFGHPQEVTLEIQEWLYERRRQQADLPAAQQQTTAQLRQEIQARFQVELNSWQINYALRKRGLTRPVGRPSHARQSETDTEPDDQPLTSGTVANVGVFFLEAARQEMGVSETIEKVVEDGRQAAQETSPASKSRLLISEWRTLWSKFDHLLYLPLLDLERPSDLYCDQSDGLRALCGFTYKYHTVEQFLGQLMHLNVARLLADALAACYSRAWYPGNEALFIFSDWHVKPHWTKHWAHSGHITMWGRVMPGTKQLIVNGPDGHLLGGWNHPVDTHLSKVLVDLEAHLAAQLNRPIAYNIFDSEGGGLPLALRYEQAQRDYISVLPLLDSTTLSTFTLKGEWQLVENDPDHEATDAVWSDTDKASGDPRRLVVMRPIGQTDPTRVYAGRIPKHLTAAQVPAAHRQRWANNERRIREMVKAANLNVNYGYSYDLVPSRTRQRLWQEAQDRVESVQIRIDEQTEAISHLQTQFDRLIQEDNEHRADLQNAIDLARTKLETQRRAKRPVRRLEQRLARAEQDLKQHTHRLQRRQTRLLNQLDDHRACQDKLTQLLTQHQADRDAIDTEALCRERNLQKDQLMLNLQVLLTNLHDWACACYFAPQWQKLDLDTAMRLIYRKSGRVVWYPDRIEVTLDAYRYAEHQQAMEFTCQRFNAADLCWRDGRRLRFYLAQAS